MIAIRAVAALVLLPVLAVVVAPAVATVLVIRWVVTGRVLLKELPKGPPAVVVVRPFGGMPN